MATISIDGQQYRVADGQNLLQACLSLGLDLPYFCWHPALGSVGACRQCALLQYQNADDQRGRLVMGCMTPVADGQILSLKADSAVAFRAGIIENLMTNHPHDCPVCEEGGECHLQDMTLMSGHHRRRFRGTKRTFRNQQLGPFISHEMNRCITCYRCVRFYRDYAGGSDLHALASRNHTYFGRCADGTLESPFAGNLVEVCPTGVFTDKPFGRHYTRKWDLQSAPSLCVHCSLGCNISPGERYGRLKRVQNRYHHAINGYFLCDRGRFGYDHVNHPGRPHQPLLTRGDQRQPLGVTEAEQQLQQRLRDPTLHWVGIGSPRATLESNRALQRLVGQERFYSGLSNQDEAISQALRQLMGSRQLRVPSLAEVEQADAVLILGEDISHSAARLALSLRQALRGRGRAQAAASGIPPWQDQAVQIAGQNRLHPLYLTQGGATALDPLARHCYRAPAPQQARLGFAVAAALSPAAPAVAELSEADRALAAEIATTLRGARRPLIICGSNAGSLALVQAAAQVLHALAEARAADSPPPWLLPVFAECNSLGLALLDRNNHENGLDTLFALAETDRLGAIIVENDLYRRAPLAAVERFLSRLGACVVIDSVPTATAGHADLLLPSTGFAETQGTLINNEGRAQALYPVYPVGESMRPAWRWLQPPTDAALDARQLLADCGTQVAELAGLAPLFAEPATRFGGMKVARMPHRYSGRTAMLAQLSVHEPQQLADPASPLAFSMEGAPCESLAQQPGAGSLLSYSWFPRWNSNQSIHKFQQGVGGPLRGGDGGLRLAWRCPSSAWLDPPAALQLAAGELLAEPQPRLFGGEELSALAAPIVERGERPHLLLHPDTAAARGIAAGDLLALRPVPGDAAPAGADTLTLPVQLHPSVSPQLVLVPQPYRAPSGAVTLHRLGPDPLIASDREVPHA